MTDALLALSVFAIPCLITAAIEQHKVEKERRKRELIEIRERDYLYGFKAGMGYQNTCHIETAHNGLKRNAQQVDKEIERYARMVY